MLNPVSYTSQSFFWSFDLFSFQSYFFVLVHPLHCQGQSLRYSPGWGNPGCCVVVLYVGVGSERKQCCLLSSGQAFSHILHYPQANWALLVLIPSRWVCVRSRTLWAHPTNSPVMLGVSPTAATPTDFYSHRFWGFLFPCWNPGLRSLSHSPVVPPNLSARKCATATHHLSWLVLQPLPCHASSLSHCPYPPLLLVWMYVSSLTPWLLDFHAVQFSGSSAFKFAVVLLLVVQGGKVYLPMRPSWPVMQLKKKLNISIYFYKNRTMHNSRFQGSSIAYVNNWHHIRCLNLDI